MEFTVMLLFLCLLALMPFSEAKEFKNSGMTYSDLSKKLKAMKALRSSVDIATTPRPRRRFQYQMGTMGVHADYSDVITPPKRLISSETGSKKISLLESAGNTPNVPNNAPLLPSNAPTTSSKDTAKAGYDTSFYDIGPMSVGSNYNEWIAPPKYYDYGFYDRFFQNNGFDTGFSDYHRFTTPVTDRSYQMGVMGIPSDYSDVIAPPTQSAGYGSDILPRGDIASGTKMGFGAENLDTTSPCTAIVPPKCWELTSDMTSSYRYSYSHVMGQCQKVDVCWECREFTGLTFNLFHSKHQCQQTCMLV